MLESLSEPPTEKLVDLTVARVGVEARMKSLEGNQIESKTQAERVYEAKAELAEIDAKIALLNDLNAYRNVKTKLRSLEQDIQAETADLATFAPIKLVDNQVLILATGRQ